MSLEFLVANDNGNSEQDIIINGNEIAAPNVYARVQELPSLDEVNPEYVLTHIHDNLIVSIKGALYYVGAYALQSNQHCHSITIGVDNDKVSSNIVYVNTLAHIAGEALATAYAKNKDLLQSDILPITVDMATAIPVSYYTAKSSHAFEDKFMNQTHKVSVFVGPHEYTVAISFRYVKCIPEGVTATHALFQRPELFTAEESFVPQNLSKCRILHIAIGEGTTEFPLTTGIGFNPSFISGTNNGNGHAISAVLPRFKKEFGLQTITRQDFSRYIRDENHKYHADALDILQPALDDEASDILISAEQVIANANNEVDVVAVYGGGSILMRKYLEPKLAAYCKRARIQLVYIDDPALAVKLEAYGLNAFLGSKTFMTLKKKHLVKQTA